MRLLIIGNRSSEISYAIDIASRNKAKVFLVDSIAGGVSYLREKGADVVFIDVHFDIAGFIEGIALERINIDVIAFGINATAKQAVSAIKSGAKEFLPLPPDEKLIAAIFASISDDSRPMIASAPAMKRIIEIADKVAKSDAHVLITGSSGTGKEVLAHYLHNKSHRSTNRFVKVNCAAIPENLLESELFGHEKGAFTGALARRIGKFEEASDGTLLLDEISEMDLKLQAKLLRAIQEKEIDRLGGAEPIKINLRIIATSNRDLTSYIARGGFREDLYFRLNVINLEIPDLSQRTEDLEALTKFFIEKYCDSNDVPVKTISDEALQVIKKHSWPGNIRELENALHRAVLLSTGSVINPDDLMIKHFEENLSEQEMHKLMEGLKDSNSIANILGISITSLKRKLKEFSENTG
jgi:two-component system response regulator FlrC